MKKLFFVIFILAIFSTASFASGVRAGAQVGAFVPGESGFRIGYYVGAFVQIPLPVPMLSTKISGRYSYAESKRHSWGRDDIKTTSGAALLVFTPPIPLLDLSVGAGVAAHNNNSTFKGRSQSGHWTTGFIGEVTVSKSIGPLYLATNATYYNNKVRGRDVGGFQIGFGGGVSFGGLLW